MTEKRFVQTRTDGHRGPRQRAIYPTRGCCSIESREASHTFFGVHPRRAPEKRGRRTEKGHQERRVSRAKSSVLLVGLKYWILPKVRSRCLIAHMCCMCRSFLPLFALRETRSGRHITSWDSARAPAIMFLAVFHAETPAHPFSPLFAGPADRSKHSRCPLGFCALACDDRLGRRCYFSERSTGWLFSETLIRSGYGPLSPTRSILPSARARKNTIRSASASLPVLVSS